MSTAQLARQAPASPGRPTPVPHAGARPDAAQIESSSNEEIIEIVGRLQRRYPAQQISRADLERRVLDFYHQFDTARIRTFVAVFVERLVRRSIEKASVPAAGGVVG